MRTSRLEDKNVLNTCPSIEGERGFATGFKAPGIDASMDSPLDGVALRKDFHATEDSVGSKRDRLLVELNCYEMEDEQSEKWILK